MRRLVFGLLILVFAVGTAAFCEEEAKSDSEDILIIRYASLVGGRNGDSAPVVSGVLSREELEWTPGEDNQEVQSVFALNDLGELARQAVQLPLEGGVVSGIYAHGDSSFEIGMNIRPARTIDSGDEVMTVMAEIKRDGELVSSPMIHTRLGERAIITAAGKADDPFLFLVIEIDRISSRELERRGLRHSWRKDYLLVDGEDVTVPVVIEKVEPVYTEVARKNKQQGRVVLRAVINEEGVIEDVEVIEGQPYGLTEQAVEAVKQWRFKPAVLKGEPVPVFYLLTINFRLE
jgi:TonB family protein